MIERLEEQQRAEEEEAARRRAEEETLAKQKAKREAERREAEEAARRQRQREEEAEQRAKARREQARGAPAEAKPNFPDQAWRRGSSRAIGSESPAAPVPGLPGSRSGGWRERERAKAAAAQDPNKSNISNTKGQDEDGFQPARQPWRPSRGGHPR